MQERQTPPRDRKKKEIMYVKFGLDLLMALTFVLFFNKQVLGGLLSMKSPVSPWAARF